MENSEIDSKEFLNFLSLACRANIEKRLPDALDANVDLNKLACNALMRHVFDDASDRRELDVDRPATDPMVASNKSANMNRLVHNLNDKLVRLLDERVFDSILSYMVPEQNNAAIGEKLPTRATRSRNKKEKSRKSHSMQSPTARSGAEVEIHVYDEIKGCRRDFKCAQSLLTSSMGYFSEITKGQKLEEMDISVHCDVTIFEWLMKWMKANAPDTHSMENLPKFDYKNVIPIMVSADFLQMKILFQDCIQYCKTNLNEIIRTSSNLVCLGDNILKKLADTLSNTEAQYIKDKKDKIKSKLFCKFISSLNDEVPNKKRGHYASLAYLYICLNCGKLITKLSAAYVPCQLQYITMKYNGEVVFNHARDSKWNINDHIQNVRKECKSWSYTYWRLWSQCHFLYCYMCRTMYAVAFADCCPYHPQQPHFYPMEQFQTTNSPIGRYPCCGSKAIRYETIIMRSGCKLRSHIPKLQSDDDACIQMIIDSFPELIKLKFDENDVLSFVDGYESGHFERIFENLFLKNTNETNTRSLLHNPLFDACMKKLQKNKLNVLWGIQTSNHQIVPRNEYTEKQCSSIGDSENSDTSLTNEFSFASKTQDTVVACIDDGTRPISNTNEFRPIWSSRYSTRHNQDNQRDYEELAFKSMSETLLHRHKLESKLKHSSVQSKTFDNAQSFNCDL